MLSLNVGCGGSKRYPFKNLECDVNCDIQKPEHDLANFICCDACHLPFKDKVFSKIFALHLIEHLSFPAVFVKECSRVANDEVHIITPNLYSKNSFKDKKHVQHFTVFTLRSLLEQFFIKTEISGEGGFWINARGNTYIFLIIEPFAMKFAFLANNLYALCKQARRKQGER